MIKDASEENGREDYWPNLESLFYSLRDDDQGDLEQDNNVDGLLRSLIRGDHAKVASNNINRTSVRGVLLRLRGAIIERDYSRANEPPSRQ